MIRRTLIAAGLALLAAFSVAQELHINDGSTWREISGVHVNDSGVWREIQEVHVNDGGTWRKVFQAAVYSVAAGSSISDSFVGGASAAIVFQTDGDINSVTIVAGTVDIADWVSPKALAPGAYTIRASVFSGSSPNSGDVLDTDLALTTERSWAQVQSGAGSRSGVLTLTLKDGGGNTLATGNVTLTATAS